MDIEKFRSMVLYLQGALLTHKPYYLRDDPLLYARVKQLTDLGSKLLSDHKLFFENVWTIGENEYRDVATKEALDICNYTLELISLEVASERKIEERKLFDSAKDKLKEAGKSLDKEDWEAVFNNLNTSLELALKEKLSIPTTIPNIKTANIIEILVKHNLGPTDYLREVKKHVFMDNKVKHVGYVPSKIDCINAIKVVEELLQKLDRENIVLNEEIKNKIYGNL